MPSSKNKVKRETRLAKISQRRNPKAGRLKAIEPTKSQSDGIRGGMRHITDASQVGFPCVGQCRSDIYTSPSDFQSHGFGLPQIPVVDKNNRPLMPTVPFRARRWIKSGRATPFWKNGIFCIRINEDVGSNKQQIVVGIDPGSKREAFTVKSKVHTYLNILSDTPYWVKEAVKTRREMRRGRRFRKTPCRKNRLNRSKGGIPPSTKSRWQSKLRIVNILKKLYPITDFVVEDVKAKTVKNDKGWNKSFSPLQTGKTFFYSELSKFGKLTLRQGYETKTLRDKLGLKKSGDKLADKFECHNVDSWVLANDVVGGHSLPENISIIKFSPIQFHRRQLHRFQPKNGKRTLYGGTISLGLKRGGVVKHLKYNTCYVGGTMNNRISLHDLKTGKRLFKGAKLSDIKFLAYNYWKTYTIPTPNQFGVPLA